MYKKKKKVSNVFTAVILVIGSNFLGDSLHCNFRGGGEMGHSSKNRVTPVRTIGYVAGTMWRTKNK